MADDKKKFKKRRRRRVAKGSVKKALTTMSRVPTAVSMFKKVGYKKPVPSLNLLLNSAIGGPAGNTRQQLARQQQLTDTTIATQTDVGGGLRLPPGGYGNYGGSSASSRTSRSSDVQLRSRTPSSQFRSAIQSPYGSPAHSQPTSRNPSAGAIGRDGVPLYFDTATPRVRLISPPGPDWSPPHRYILRPTKAREERKKKKGSRRDPIVISPTESMLSEGSRRRLPTIPTQVSQTPGILSSSWIDPRASWDRRQRLEDIHDDPTDIYLSFRSRMRKWFGERWGLNKSQHSQGGARADAVSPPSGPSPGMLFTSQRQKDMYTGMPDEISTIWDEPQPVGLDWSPDPDPMFGIQTPKQLSAAGLNRHSTPQFSQSNYGEGFYEPSFLMGNFPTPDIGNLDERPTYSPMMRPPSQQTDYPMPSHEPTEAFWDMLPRAPTVPQEILPGVITSAVRAQDPSNIPFTLESPEGVADSIREDPREMPSALNLPVLTPTEQTASNYNTQRAIAAQSSQRGQRYTPRSSIPRPITTPISSGAAQEKQTVVGGQRKSRRQRGLEPKSSGST